MQFNSVKRGNFSGLARATNRATDSIFDSARSTSVDHTAIAKESIKGRSQERRAAMQAEGKVARAGLQAFSKTKDTKNKIDSAEKINDIKRPARRMAGVVAGLGAISQAAVMNKNLKDDKRERAEMRALEQQNFDTKMGILKGEQEQTRAMIEQMRSGLGNASVPAVDSSTNTDTTGSSTNQSQPAASTPASSVQTMSSLTGAGKTLADAIAKYESGKFGYEAFNQGGAAGGTKVLGKSGNHKTTFGTSLTDMTLSDIFHRQNTKQRGLSMQEHLDSGGLHAVGRYQFIGSTLQDEVRRMGLDPKTTKFTPEVQDQIFLSHIKRAGSISPWVGPMQHYSQSEKDSFNSMIQQL